MSKSSNNTPSQFPGTLREEEDDDIVDSRIARAGATEERGARGVSEDVERNGKADLYSERAYLELMQAEFEQTSLPKPPTLAGWHLCWLTTTSPYDPISKRLRLGYQIVTIEELGGFDPSQGQGLQAYQGAVTCNEMVLAKIPEVYFQRMMKHFHHTLPAEGQQATLEKIRQKMEQEHDAHGKDLGQIMGDGYLEMEKSAKRPSTTPHFSS